MVLDLGFLGDTVHLLPALWMVRQAWPQAELHVAVSSHIASIMNCVPWVNRTWGYMRYPRHATLRENWDMVARLRREKFDVVINLNGSDRSSWLTFLSGAPERLGREPQDGGPWFWRRMFTAHVRHPTGSETVLLQRCHCLAQAGLPFTRPEFHVETRPTDLAAAELTAADAATYFHISPFTTADHKELSPAQLAGFLGALRRRFPAKRLVLTCSPAARELEKMKQLLALLPEKPWRVCAGSLNLEQLTAVIRHAAIHFSGDTGTLHLAVMTGTPAVTWFWPNPGLRQWIAEDDKYPVIVGANTPGQAFLTGVANDALIAAAESVMNLV